MVLFLGVVFLAPCHESASAADDGLPGGWVVIGVDKEGGGFLDELLEGIGEVGEWLYFVYA